MWTWDQGIEATAYGCFFPAHVLDNPDALPKVWDEFFNAKQRWPNFTPAELRCKGSGDLRIHYATLDGLQRLRERVKRPIVINSYYRSPAYNTQVGGSPNSRHLAGMAVDTPLFNTDLGVMSMIYHATEAGFRGFGWYPKQGFNHIDTGPHRVWIDR